MSNRDELTKLVKNLIKIHKTHPECFKCEFSENDDKLRAIYFTSKPTTTSGIKGYEIKLEVGYSSWIDVSTRLQNDNQDYRVETMYEFSWFNPLERNVKKLMRLVVDNNKSEYVEKRKKSLQNALDHTEMMSVDSIFLEEE